MTRGQLRSNIQETLGELGLLKTRFQDSEINEVIQDVYNEAVLRSRCIISTDTLPFEDDVVYYDFGATIPDYGGFIAGFNNNTNRWLKDNFSKRELDSVQIDWESRFYGEPEFLIPHSFKYAIIVPKYKIASGSFLLKYWATAPVLVDDSSVLTGIPDGSVILVEVGAVASLLEGDEEISKSINFRSEFEDLLGTFKEGVENLAKIDLLRRVGV